MKFEEQFPSLKEEILTLKHNGEAYMNNDLLCLMTDKKSIVMKKETIIKCKKCKTTEEIEVPYYHNDFIIIDKIKEYCLDKQKVKDALIKVFGKYSDNISRTSAAARLIHEIEQELGL